MENDNQDKLLVCRECSSEFIFSSREQDFYTQKGFDHAPTRCQQCRNDRRRERPQQPVGVSATARNYLQQHVYRPAPGNSASQRPSTQVRSGGISNGYRSNGYGNRQFGPNYSTLGRNTVGNGYNTRPNSYTSSGNVGNYSGNNMNRSGNNGFNTNSSQTNLMDRKMYPIVCHSCNIRTEVPFAPREGAPVFCRTCYNSQKNSR